MPRWNTRTLHQWDQVVCPECQHDLDLQQDDLVEEQVVSCMTCGSRFEVMTNPFELRRAEDFDPTPGIHGAAA